MATPPEALAILTRIVHAAFLRGLLPAPALTFIRSRLAEHGLDPVGALQFLASFHDAAHVFNALDQNGDGFPNVQELARQLDNEAGRAWLDQLLALSRGLEHPTTRHWIGLPVAPSWPRRARNFSLGLVVGLAGGLAFALLHTCVDAFVLATLWAWLISPSFPGAPAVGFGAALAVCVLKAWARRYEPNADVEADPVALLKNSALTLVARPALLLLVGRCLRSFVS